MRELGGKRKAQVFLLLGLVLTSRLTERKTESGFSFRKRACALQTMSASPSAHVCAGGWWERAKALIRLESEKMELILIIVCFSRLWRSVTGLYYFWDERQYCHTQNGKFRLLLQDWQEVKIYRYFIYYKVFVSNWIIRSLIYSCALLHCLTRISDSYARCLDIIYDDILFWINSCNT